MAAGALPVVVDVEPRTWTLDLDQVEAAITPRTKAIMPVHLGHTFGANYRLGELHAALLVTQTARFEAQRAERETDAELFEELAPQVQGVTIKPRDARITRWSFYNHIFAIDPDAFGGATNDAVAAALEAEGIPAEVQYPPMSRYDLYQPSLSRLPVAVEFAERLDPAKMSFPVAEAAGERESIYLMENTFRAGREGIDQLVEALAKVQRHAAELGAAT